MTFKEYYDMFKEQLCINIEESLKETHSYSPLLGKNKAFCDEYDKWISILEGRTETYIYRNAIKAYQEAYSNMLMGLYQPAYMGLRYFLERSLMGVYFSASEIEMLTWKAGERDTYWTELVGVEDKNNSPNEANKGIYSAQFTRAFFREFEPVRSNFLQQTKTVYRDCSVYVHGNPSAIDKLGEKFEYNEELADLWNNYADTVARCILYAFMLRYWKILAPEQKDIVRDRLFEEFSSTDTIKDFL